MTPETGTAYVAPSGSPSSACADGLYRSVMWSAVTFACSGLTLRKG
jgi:hypothetical protein